MIKNINLTTLLISYKKNNSLTRLLIFSKRTLETYTPNKKKH